MNIDNDANQIRRALAISLICTYAQDGLIDITLEEVLLEKIEELLRDVAGEVRHDLSWRDSVRTQLPRGNRVIVPAHLLPVVNVLASVEFTPATRMSVPATDES